MEIKDLFKITTDQLKEWFSIAASISGIIFGAYKIKFHVLIFRLWKKYIIPIWQTMVGTKQINKRFDDLFKIVNDNIVQQKMNTQNVMSGMDIINNNIETLSNDHKRLFAFQWSRENEDETSLIAHTNEKGDVLRVNRLFTKTVGRQKEDLTGTGWFNIIDSNDRNRVIIEYSDSIKFKRDFESKFQMIDSNGKPFDVECRGVRISDDNGKIIGYYIKISKQ